MKTKFNFFSVLMLLCIIIIGTNAYSADPAQYGTPFSGVPDPRDATIYQVNMRCFSSTRNLQGVINRLDNIKALGVNVIQLMPVQPVATLNAFNSPYAWKDFVTVGSEYGTLTTLRALVDGAHSRGMAVIMDWVANQTGWDHPWITAHKDWYVQVNGVIQNLNGWTDVAALNMANTSMRTEQINAMRYWVFAANIDGFRCDYANNYVSYWGPVISNLRGITSHKLLMVAEGDGSALYGQGFDMTFSWNFYNNLKAIQTGSAATLIDASNSYDYSGATGSQQVIRWLTNHDIYGSEGSPYTIFGGKASVLGKFAITAYMKSVPFIYNGEEVGNTVAMPFPFTSSVINWTQDVSITPEITKIIAHRNYSAAIRRGTLTTYNTADVCVFKKVYGTETVFVMVNMRNAGITINLPSGIANTTMYDAYTNAAVGLTSNYYLSAYQWVVLKLETSTTVPVIGITLSPTSATIGINGTTQLTATVAPANATNKSVTWSSSNTAIVTVSTTGLVTGKVSGTATITVKTTDGAKTATCAITVTASTATYYTIKNRWKGTYLYDAGANVGYGTTVANNNYKWEKVTIDATFFWLKNLGTGEYMHIENQTGSVQCTAVTAGWWSSQWSADYIDGTWTRIRNRWQTGNIIHVENQTGSAQYAGAQDGWYSAQWQFSVVAKSAETEVDNTVNMHIYPNPASHNVHIEMKGLEGQVSIQILDLNGKLVQQLLSNESYIDLNLNNLTNGIYFVKAYSDQGVFVERFIKQ